MKQYYYLVGDTQFGPFNSDELLTKSLTPDTMVWAAGMPNWIRAGNVPELSSLFMTGAAPRAESMPPPAPAAYYAPLPPGGAPHPAGAYFASTPKPRNWLVESILVTLFCCLPFGIAGIVFASRVDSAYNAGDSSGALKASDEAGKWTKIGFFVGLAVIVLYALLAGAGLVASLSGNNRY